MGKAGGALVGVEIMDSLAGSIEVYYHELIGFSSPTRDLRDVAPLTDALGVFGVDGAALHLAGVAGRGSVSM